MAASESWKAAVSLNNKDILVKKNNVRRSELNQLPYQNTVTHLPIGIMHHGSKVSSIITFSIDGDL